MNPVDIDLATDVYQKHSVRVCSPEPMIRSPIGNTMIASCFFPIQP